MSHRNEEREDHRSSMRQHRHEVPHIITPTTHRTQHISPSAKHKMDRYSVPVNILRSGGGFGYGKCLD